MQDVNDLRHNTDKVESLTAVKWISTHESYIQKGQKEEKVKRKTLENVQN